MKMSRVIQEKKTHSAIEHFSLKHKIAIKKVIKYICNV